MNALLNLFRKPAKPTVPIVSLDEVRLQTLENVRYLSSCLKAVNAKIADLNQRGGAKTRTKLASTEQYRVWLESKLIEETFNLKIIENK
jgi:hypothetical protein